MEEEIYEEYYEEIYSTDAELQEFQETFEKFQEIYGKVTKLTWEGVENETKNQNNVRFILSI